ADALHINRKRIGYAGNKDRNAITEQNMSIRNIKKERVEKLKLKDIELKFLGYSKEPISLGDLKGNSFEITVRNILEQPKKVEKIINYFGEQRFSKNNAEIGKTIIQKDFEKVVDRILDSIGEEEKKVIEHLKKNRNDFVGALKTMPWKTLNLYIHAYQSKLWNDIVKELIKKRIKENKIPLIGFATEIQDKNVKQVVEKVMQNEKIIFNDFVIRAIPDLSSAGTERNLFAEVKDLKIGKLENDELNKGKKKVKISFSLGKGSYATEVVKALF
nr:tRNA pseudouridine(13) synthase TruD [Nanoarchaeota archaeon]